MLWDYRSGRPSSESINMWPAGDETNKSGRFNSRFEIKDLCYKLHRKHHHHGIMGNGCIFLGAWLSRRTKGQDIWAFNDMNSTVPFKNLSLVSSPTLWKNCTWMLECPFNIWKCPLEMLQILEKNCFVSINWMACFDLTGI